MKHIKLFEDWLVEKTKLPKNQYVELSPKDAADYADDIIDLSTMHMHILEET